LISNDLLAGLAVGLLLVPQSLAYASLAGMPPIHGLYCALLPVIVGACAGWCHQMHTGPVAMTALLVTATLAPLAEPGSDHYIALASMLALLVGVVRIALGIFQAADLTRLVSHPVLCGFTAAAAIVIASTQVPALIGAPSMARGVSPVVGAITSCSTLLHPHWATLAMGAFCLAALLAFRRFPRWPGALIVMTLATCISAATGYDGATVGALPAGIPPISFPHFEIPLLGQLVSGAVMVAFIGFAEVMSVTRTAATRTRQSIDLNRELIGQGMASLAAAVSAGFPPSGSLSRSALMLAVGGRTAIAAIASTLVVFAVLLGGTHLLASLPLAALAALVLVAVLPLIRIQGILEAWRVHPHDGIAGGATLCLTLVLAPRMVDGFIAGIAIGICLFLWRQMRPRIADCARHPDGTWRDHRRHGLVPPPFMAVLRPDGRLCFTSASSLEQAVQSTLTARPDLRGVVLACDGVAEIDATGFETLRSIARTLSEHGIISALSGLKHPVEETMHRTNLFDIFAPHHVYRTTDEAVRGLAHELQLTSPPWEHSAAVPGAQASVA
jgi:SulP family sulfate permease